MSGQSFVKYSMVQHIAITKARINLGQLVRRIHINKECFILEKDGIPIAALLDIDGLEDYMEMKSSKIKAQIRHSTGQYRKGKVREAEKFLTSFHQKMKKRKHTTT